MTPWRHRVFLVAADILILLAAGAGALMVDGITSRVAGPWQWYVPAGAAVFVAIFAACGLYSRLWRYASIRDMLALVAACSVAGAVLLFVATVPPGPRLLYWLLATGGLGSVRFAFRVSQEFTRRPAGAPVRRVLIVGAGEAGVELTRELVRHPDLGLKPVGFVDDDAAKRQQVAWGLPVVGACSETGTAAAKLGADEVIIAMPSAGGHVIRTVWNQARTCQLPVRILPLHGVRERGQWLARQVRSLQVEDLLGRPEVQLDPAALCGYLPGRCVMVTGAGGSIGSELCRQVARVGPAAMVLLGHGENSLFQTALELKERFGHLPVHTVVGDLQDARRMHEVIGRFRPAVIFHAAAHKHVALMERNPGEAVKNNVLGTYNVARAAAAGGVERFVLISTDKAVNPTSVMGATKRAAEQIVKAMAPGSPTTFVIVRFGNVLGSRGSVVPLFQQQIARGGPVTITHPEATRYFMTIPEASRLVVQAAALGRSGDLFVLDMGQPVRIADLAEDMIRLAGLEPGVDIPITVTGLQPGEKLDEELFTAEEGLSATRHERIFQAQPQPGDRLELEGALEAFRSLALRDDVTCQAILSILEERRVAHEQG